MKAEQWFTICGTSTPPGLTIGWNKIQLLLSHFHQWPILTLKTFRKWWTIAPPSMTAIWCFPSYYCWKIKLLYLFLYLLIQILSQNHNCNSCNIFFNVLIHNIARSVNGQCNPICIKNKVGKWKFCRIEIFFFTLVHYVTRGNALPYSEKILYEID